MATINIGNKISIRYPDNGEKNWGTVLRDAFETLANYVTENIEGAAKKSENNIFTGEMNVFQNQAKMRFFEEGHEDIKDEKFNILRVADAEVLRTNQGNRNENGINSLYALLGINDSKDILANIENQMTASGKPSGFSAVTSQLNLFTSDAARDNFSVSNFLGVLLGLIDGLVPVGSIRPSWGLGNEVLAHWAIAEEDEVGAIEINGDFLESEHVHGSEAGYYKLSGGLWAACDGVFPLPPALAGGEEIATRISCWIPNLSEEAFLKGGRKTTEDVKGDNFFTLNINNLPNHAHTMTHSHSASSIEGGRHRHAYIFNTYSSSSRRVAISGGDMGNASSGVTGRSQTSNTQTIGDHTHSIVVDNFTGDTEEVGEGANINYIPKSLQVAYYLRVR